MPAPFVHPADSRSVIAHLNEHNGVSQQTGPTPPPPAPPQPVSSAGASSGAGQPARITRWRDVDANIESFAYTTAQRAIHEATTLQQQTIQAAAANGTPLLEKPPLLVRGGRIPTVSNHVPATPMYRQIDGAVNINAVPTLVVCSHCNRVVTKQAFPAHHERCRQFFAQPQTVPPSAAATNFPVAAPSSAMAIPIPPGARPISAPPPNDREVSNSDTVSSSGHHGKKKRKHAAAASAHEESDSSSSNKKQRSTLDLDTICGVPTGSGPCQKGLTCKKHTQAAKKAVHGRTFTYDTLRRKENKSKRDMSNSASSDSDDSDSSQSSSASSSSDSDSDGRKKSHKKSKLNNIKSPFSPSRSQSTSTLASPSNEHATHKKSKVKKEEKKEKKKDSGGRDSTSASQLASPVGGHLKEEKAFMSDGDHASDSIKTDGSKKRVRKAKTSLLSFNSPYSSSVTLRQTNIIQRRHRQIASLFIMTTPKPFGADPTTPLYQSLMFGKSIPPTAAAASTATVATSVNQRQSTPRQANGTAPVTAAIPQSVRQSSSTALYPHQPAIAVPQSPSHATAVGLPVSTSGRPPSTVSLSSVPSALQSVQPTSNAAAAAKNKKGKKEKDKDKEKEKKKGKDKEKDKDNGANSNGNSGTSKGKGKDKEKAAKNKEKEKEKESKEKKNGKGKDKKSKDKDKEKEKKKGRGSTKKSQPPSPTPLQSPLTPHQYAPSSPTHSVTSAGGRYFPPVSPVNANHNVTMSGSLRSSPPPPNVFAPPSQRMQPPYNSAAPPHAHGPMVRASSQQPVNTAMPIPHSSFIPPYNNSPQQNVNQRSLYDGNGPPPDDQYRYRGGNNINPITPPGVPPGAPSAPMSMPMSAAQRYANNPPQQRMSSRGAYMPGSYGGGPPPPGAYPDNAPMNYRPSQPANSYRPPPPPQYGKPMSGTQQNRSVDEYNNANYYNNNNNNISGTNPTEDMSWLEAAIDSGNIAMTQQQSHQFG